MTDLKLGGKRPVALGGINNFVAVRFSLRMNEAWIRKAYGNEENREAWFAMRAEFFKKWLVRAIFEQTAPVRRVFVFMDTADERLWIRYLNLPSPFFPVFTAGTDQSNKLRELIFMEGLDNVVISRIDSDDTISVDYFEELNREVSLLIEAGESRRYIVACSGFITNLSEIQSIYYNCCPFISIYTEKYDGSVIYDFEHEKVLEREPVLNTSASWMQIIHGTNIANKLHQKSRFQSDDIRKMVIGPNLPVKSSWPCGFRGFIS